MKGKKASVLSVSGPMSLDIFLSEVKEHYQTLESKDTYLLGAYHIFANNMDISLEQYKRISSSVQQVGETVEELCMLLSDAESLPPSARSYRYLPLVAFQYMEGQVQAILAALANLRQLRKTSSSQKSRLKLVIHNKLKSLKQDLQEGLRHLQDLADQALLEEKRMSRFPSMRQQKLFVMPNMPLSKEPQQDSDKKPLIKLI